MLTLRLSVLVVVLCGCFSESVRAADGPVIPPDALAFGRFDPSGFDSNGAMLLPTALRFAEQLGLVDPEFHPLFDGILAASVAGAVPHTICLLDFDVRLDEAHEKGFEVERLSAVLMLESAAKHRSFLAVLETIISHMDEGAAAEPVLFELPNGVTAARLLPESWEPWQAMEWASAPYGFLVGMGEGSLEAWTLAQQSDSDQRFLANHRLALGDRAIAGASFIEMWINLERFHAAMPDVMAQGRVRRWLTTWKVDGARNWMLHGRWADRFLLADVTWQRVGDGRDEVAHRALTQSSWPEDLSLPVPQGQYVVVVPIDLRAAFDRVLAARRALISAEKLEEFDRTMLRYRAKQERVYDALWDAFKPWLVLSNDPPATLPIPGATTVFFELNDAREARATQMRMTALLEQFMETPELESLGESVVRFDREKDVYWLQLDPKGMLRVPSWGWVDGFLIGGWSPVVVETHRQRLNPRRRR